MSGFSTIRILTAAVLVASTVAVSSVFSQTMPATAPAVSAPTGSALATTGPAPAPVDPNAPIATINGKDINNALFHGILMQVAGMRVFQQVFDLAIVQQACTLSGIPQEGKEYNDRLTAEYEKTLNGMVLTGANPTKADKEAALGQLLQQQQLTLVEFRLRLETQAGLRALAVGKITVTDKEVTDAYEAQYGERRTVHVIPVKDLTQAAEVRKAIDGGKTAIEVGNELKIPVTQMIVPASAEADKSLDDLIKVIRVTLTKPKQLSTGVIQIPNGAGGTQGVLVYMDTIDADKRGANPKTPKLLDEVKTNVFNFKEGQWMTDHLTRLRAAASVKINDQILSQQFENVARAMQAQAAAAAAATQPAGITTAPATQPKTGGNTLTAPARGN